MRVVLDSNVLISALIFDGLPEQAVLTALAGANDLLLSAYIIEETSRILSVKFNVSSQNVRLYEQLMSQAEIQYFQPFLDLLTDEADNRILETAIKGQVNYLVTGERLLLDLKGFEAVKIITPAHFLTLQK